MNVEDLKASLLRDLRNLYVRLDNDENDDCNIIIKIGQERFKAHSVILKARSRYFRNFIDNEYKKEDISKRISVIFSRKFTFEIPFIQNPKVFELCLKYIYTGELPLRKHENDLIFCLISAASELNLDEMVNHIQNYFIGYDDNLRWIEQNLFEVYQISLKYSNLLPKLKNQCEDFIKKNPKLMFESKNFHNLEKNHLIDLIKFDDLPLLEVEVWRYLIKWVYEQEPIIINKNVENWNDSDIAKVKKRMEDFIPHIRFFTIPSTMYHSGIRPYREIIPPNIIEELEKFYLVENTPLPPDALPPRRNAPSVPLRRKETIKRKESIINVDKEPPSETIPENIEPIIPERQFARSIITAPAIPPKVPSIIRRKFKDSELINEAQIRRISCWIDGIDSIDFNNSSRKRIFFLLTRGSRDGMSNERFHLHCDNKGPTIILAKVEGTNDIIGGYNPFSWTSSNEWKETDKSFIFSFKYSNDIILSRVKNPAAAIWDGDNGYDVGFSSDLQLFYGNYKCENYKESIMDDLKFKIIEYEVFKFEK